MAKCENCYHHDICIFHGASGCERCMQYKDKSLIVELPCMIGNVVYATCEPFATILGYEIVGIELTDESAKNAIMELKLNPKIYVVREFRR